ncbi:mannitol dehydrogenase family protein [uncultured Dysosmobacter sp.]|uniref:mannitol dehydrogenase family protein n=1 Tax=uncultured Dysosmobacter sp. TaxID=2591384 RepID=UPI00262436D7|nr:mannitol dehydrogenase family protein [uncultured Dysosmobacter sp.]
MKLSYESIQDRAAWEAAGVTLPKFDWKDMHAATEKAPTWVHFGSGSLFRAFHSMLQQSLIEQGLVKGGLYTAETFDYEIVDNTYGPYDNLSLLVTLMPDGNMEKTVVGSVAGALRADPSYPEDWEKLKSIFRNPSLQLITFTITEKGYALTGMDGKFLPMAEKDFAAGPEKCVSAMGKVTALLLERFNAGGTPMAVVSTDNCSRNGEKIRSSVVTMTEKWVENGFASRDFAAWVEDENKVSFPWTMIDKITPRPAPAVEKALADAGFEDMKVKVTSKNGYTAAFVNAENPQYLVIEDRFPNGRPPLEKAGVFMTDRDTVNNVERMKVMTCLNPLHTALAVYGCLLGYNSIAAELRDPELKSLIEKIGYVEGMPVVTDPGIIKPMDFIHEVIDRRFPNPFMPDTPQRIASDTSQKISIRFGETIKAYAERPGLDPKTLTFIPLAIAGWLRYLLAVDDEGKPFECSGDPILAELQAKLSGVTLGDPDSVDGKLEDILRNPVIFGSDLVELGLSERIEGMVRELLAGPGAVRATLKKYLGH